MCCVLILLFLCVMGRAGATASVDCSQCQAGTYGTGSGKGLRMKIAFALTLTSSILLSWLFESSLLHFLSLRLGRALLLGICRVAALAETYCLCVAGRAGATASVNCSLCQAGTYGTGPGEGLRMKSLLLCPARRSWFSVGIFLGHCSIPSWLGT